MDSTGAEEWRKLALEPFSDFYEVSNHGRVRSLDRTGRGGRSGNGIRGYRGRTMNNKPNQRGYIAIALTFIPNPDNLPEVNQIDGDKTNNRVENLEWCNRVQNHAHGCDVGLITKCFVRKLSDAQVHEIRENGKWGSWSEMGDHYGVHFTTISRIIKGHRRATT